MARKAVVDAVVAQLQAGWTTSQIIAPGLETDAPNDGSGFVTLQFPVANTERPPLTTRLYREVGAFRIVIAVERAAGQALALAWADTLATLFRDTVFGGVHTQVPNSGSIDDSNDEGNYFVTSVVVPYWATFTD